MKKIAHLTSVHYRYDTRIFFKQCASLAANDFYVFLIVVDGKGNEKNNNVSIIDVGASNGRLSRILNAPRRVFSKAVELDADIYHLHDPELIPIGLKLKKLGKTVIFDAHEDIAKDILSKTYLKGFQRVVSKTYSLYERWACRKLDIVIAATPYINKKYLTMGIRSIDINNYPVLGELAVNAIDWSVKKNQVCYVGDITRVRGILQTVEAMGLVASDTKLQLVGSFSDLEAKKLASTMPGWKNIQELGFLDRRGVADALAYSVAGLVNLLPAPNHIDSQPNKMFEYMSAGVPVISSDFPLWKEIIEGNSCGLCVDPFDTQAIADAIDYLVNNPAEAEAMGRRGQSAVENKYNWAIEEEKLLALYSSF